MVLMENGRMDSNLQVVDSHIITELGNKAVTNRLSDGSESSVTFENHDDVSRNTFSNCNGNSTSSDELPSLINGIKSCNNHDGNSYKSDSKGSNSSQCCINSVQKTINSSLENSLSNLSLKADLEEVSLKITESSCVNCDNSSSNNDCSTEFDQETRSVNANEPKTDICCTSATTVQDDAQSSHKSENEERDEDSSEIVYICYESEKQMPDIMKLIQKDLSEPYSIYTYRYFIHNWPHLCFLALCKGKSVGAIVCKLDIHRKIIKRGYIAMLAVDESYRKHGIGSNLVLKAIRVMAAEGADEVVLETEITNQPALHLYENLGFVRDKRLFRYYLNGVDALRLKLWLR